jgi:hypothetical protein
MQLTVSRADNLPLEEVVEWLQRGMQDFCEFEYAEIEECNHTEDVFDFELRIIQQDRISDKASLDSMTRALNEFCQFEESTVYVKESFDGIWVKDDYQVADSN